MRILIACEFSGVVRDAFEKRGHDAWSCDLLPTTSIQTFGSLKHVQQDISTMMYRGCWELMVAFPPCTHLAVSGAWKFKDKQNEQAQSLAFVRQLLDAPIDRIALENPVGIISTRIRRPDQIIQPYQFGHDASKRTCLWLKNLPPLQPTSYVEPTISPSGKPVWGNQTPSGQNKLGPSPDRWKKRSITYQGIANAMAEQWG